MAPLYQIFAENTMSIVEDPLCSSRAASSSISRLLLALSILLLLTTLVAIRVSLSLLSIRLGILILDRDFLLALVGGSGSLIIRLSLLLGRSLLALGLAAGSALLRRRRRSRGGRVLALIGAVLSMQ